LWKVFFIKRIQTQTQTDYWNVDKKMSPIYLPDRTEIICVPW